MTPIGRMLVIISATLMVTKALTLAVARAQGTVLGPLATAEYLGWMGMRPSLFAKKRNADPRGAAALAAHGARMFLLGALLFATARIVAAAPLEPVLARGLVTIVAMAGLSLMLHFGLFDLAAAFYRLRGVPVEKLFRAPLASRSLSEFWSRRWNTGYSEMIALVVHRPVRRTAGETAALAASFLASGLLHELAISVPVRAGYGLPTLYFLLHGGLVAIERRMGKPPGRLWTMFWLTVPLPLLFHPPFLRGVIWPMVDFRRCSHGGRKAEHRGHRGSGECILKKSSASSVLSVTSVSRFSSPVEKTRNVIPWSAASAGSASRNPSRMRAACSPRAG